MNHAPLMIADLPPVPWVRERDVDLLLAELLSTELALIPRLFEVETGAHWRQSLDLSFCEDIPLPTGVPTTAHAVVNFSRPTAEADATGETDVLVVAGYGDEHESLLLSIENKVWASKQPNQGARHRRFVESRGNRWRVAAVVAPAAWIASNQSEVADYHVAIELESLASWCSAHGFKYQAAVFTQACTRPVNGPAPDLHAWHALVSGLLLDEFGIALEPQNFVRTSNEGSAKPNRWVACERSTLGWNPAEEQPWLELKPRSTGFPARAVVRIPKASDELIDWARGSGPANGFVVRVTSSGTLLVEHHEPEAAAWTTNMPFEEQVVHIRLVARAAFELRSWWNAVAAEVRSGDTAT